MFGYVPLRISSVAAVIFASSSPASSNVPTRIPSLSFSGGVYLYWAITTEWQRTRATKNPMSVLCTRMTADSLFEVNLRRSLPSFLWARRKGEAFPLIGGRSPKRPRCLPLPIPTRARQVLILDLGFPIPDLLLLTSHF